MAQPSLIRRASSRALNSLRRKLSRDRTRSDDGSSMSQRSERSSFSTSSLFTTTTLEEDEYMHVDETIPEDPEKEASPHHQMQSPFFCKLPPEIREQIYREFWAVAGVERHAFRYKGRLTYSPCITNHEAPDERQAGIEKAFRPAPDVQYHPSWFKKLQSPWCNHWKCEKLWEDIRDGREVDFNKGKNPSFISLLVSCKRIHAESINSFLASKTLNITDGPTLQRIIKFPRPRYLTAATTINISLRDDSGNWLYLNGVSVWHMLLEPEMKDLRRIYVWLDADCPLTRRLLPEFRELYSNVPEPIAQKLTMSLPCDEDGFWAWGPVEMESLVGGVTRLEKLEPGFTVVARGRQKFHDTSNGLVSRVETGLPCPRVLRSGNPFEDILLYGRGFYDDAYH